MLHECVRCCWCSLLPPAGHSLCALLHRSSRYGSTHDVHYSVPADRQSGPGGLEATELGLQLVLHVRPLMSCFLSSRLISIRMKPRDACLGFLTALETIHCKSKTNINNA